MARIPPPWEMPSPKETAAASGRWVKGMQSPNPAGRPKGLIDKRQRLVAGMAEDAEDIVRVVVQRAKDGDMQAAALVLNRVTPTLRPTAEKVEFEFDPTASVATQATQIMVAISKGQVDPHMGKMLYDCLSAHIGMKDVETFLSELSRLRENKKSHISGGVVIDEHVPTSH